MSGHYLIALHLARTRTLAIGALGPVQLAAGDYVYVGSAQRGLAARIDRHRRIGKAMHWHVDYLRDATRWIEARRLEGARGRECRLARRVEVLPGAERIDGFGSSDCRCKGHLYRFADGIPRLPGVLDPAEGIEAAFVERPNRFVVLARLANGRIVRAHLPNTGRLVGQLDPDRPLILQPTDNPTRATAYTATRSWTGHGWLSLEASRAPALLEAWIRRQRHLPELGTVRKIEREVTIGRHRLDLELGLADDVPAWVEVKSLTIAEHGIARFSRTPSTRGAAHLELLGDLRERGERVAAVFVVQRGDARRLVADDAAATIWMDAIRRAHARGVLLLAYRCKVTPSDVWIQRRIPIEL